MPRKVSRSRRSRPPRLPRRIQPEAAARNASPEDAALLEARLLEQIAASAKLCREIEKQLVLRPAPELSTVIQVHRLLILKLSAEAPASLELLPLIGTLMKPVLDWARLEEHREDRELALQKHKDQMAAQQETREKEKPGPGKALTDSTREKIEHELKFF